MIQLLKKVLRMETFSLTEEFQSQVLFLAKGLKSEDVTFRVKKIHYGFLNSPDKEQYKATTEYKFLSEHFNDCPDLLLRAQYRKQLTDKK